jgi:phosphatidylglycerol---prolipoprotein diacylglyceryl transferase
MHVTIEVMKYPDIDPIFLRLGPLEFRWYGLAYIMGVLGTAALFKRFFQPKFNLNEDQLLNMITAGILGILLGGRIGYVLVYDFSYFMSTPLDVFAFWKGGMSYHGGAVGAITGIIVFARLNKLDVWGLLDMLAWGSTIGIFFGRLANFINGELFGRVGDVPWAMVFPGGGSLARHPSQLYEAFFEGAILFLILWFLFKKARLKAGQLGASYLIFYGVFRFFIEFFRQPDSQLGFVFGPFSMGQILCFGMIFIGVFFYRFRRKDLFS